MSIVTDSGKRIFIATGSLTGKFKINFGTAPASGVVETGNWVRGAVINLAAASLFTLTSGDITASGLPIGVTCDTAGDLSGMAYECRSAQTVTFTRGVETQQVDIGVVRRAGTQSPYGDTFNADPDSLPSPTTTQSAATLAAVKTAAQAAVDDSATAAATPESPVVHLINYTGADADDEIVFSGSSTPATGVENTYIVINGNGKSIRFVDFTYKGARIIWTNWTLRAWVKGDPKTPGALVTRAGSQHWFHKCKIGPWHGPDRITLTGFEYSMADCVAGSRTGFEKCWFAGWQDDMIINVGATNTRVYVFDCMISHLGEDGTRCFGGTNDIAAYYVDGITITNFITASALDHTDALIQTGGGNYGGPYIKEFQFYNCFVNGDSARYGVTGIRQDKQGTSPGLAREAVRAKNVVVLASGYTGAVFDTIHASLDGFMVAPSPGIGTPNSAGWINFAASGGETPPGTSSLRNLIRDQLSFGGGWSGNALTVQGSDTTYTSNNAASLAATFPNLTGAMEIHNRHAGAGAGTANASIFVPDEVDFVLHPDSIRAAFSARYEPAIGWGEANGAPDDPAALESGWDHIPVETFTPPSLTSASASTTSCTITTNAADGVLWYQLRDKTESVNTYPAVAFGTPTRCQMRCGACRDGSFTGPHDGSGTYGDAISPVQEWGIVPVNSAGSQTINFGTTMNVGDEVAVMHETYAGHISDVELVAVT